jgi:hypothetical protein
MIGVMNNTKWEELRIEMYELKQLCPLWRTRDVKTGYVSDWHSGWYYHFNEGGYETIEWVELQIENSEQYTAVEEQLKSIHVPGHEIEGGFRVYGFVKEGQVVDYV